MSLAMIFKSIGIHGLSASYTLVNVRRECTSNGHMFYEGVPFAVVW